MEHCVIGGVPCSKCCEVIALDNKDYQFLLDVRDSLDYDYAGMLTPMSAEEAVSLNPLMQERITLNASQGGKGVFFYSCKYLKDNMCSNYEGRPSMCYNYPYRRGGFVDTRFHLVLSIAQYQRKEPAYAKGCTYLPEIIPVVNI